LQDEVLHFLRYTHLS